MRDDRSLADRLADARQQRDRIRAVDTTAQRALEYSKVYLDRAEKALKADRPFVADRLLSVANALRHIAQIRERLHDPDRARDHERDHSPGPEGDRNLPPPAGALQWVYFRVQQADFFYEQSNDPEAKAFPKWAKDFYQLAVRDIDRQDAIAAEANARCAEEVVRVLENLAQAAAPTPPPPDMPGPPRPGSQPAPPETPHAAWLKPEPAMGPSASSYSRTQEILE